jgi:hypothetical protein
MSLALSFRRINTPREWLERYALDGGRCLARYVADLADGQLRLMVAQEPAGKGGRRLTHVSLSVGRGNGPPHRRPSDEESQAALSLFPLVEFDEMPTDHPQFRHFWERQR